MSHLFLEGKHPDCTQEKKKWTDKYYIAQMNVDCSKTCTGTVCSITVIESDQKKRNVQSLSRYCCG